MKLDEMRKIAEARTKGVWSVNRGGDDPANHPGIDVDGIPLLLPEYTEGSRGVYIKDAEFISLAANTYDLLLDVAEASINLFNDEGKMIGLEEFQEALKKLDEEIGE